MKLDGFSHRTVRAGEVNLHAVIGGSGSPVLLIHGFPQTWWEWRKVMPRLAEQHSVVAMDLRGAGHSDSPLTGYDKATLAADAHSLMNALGFDKYAVCGHDIGAMVATALAFTQRESISHLAILDAPLPGWSQWESNLADPNTWHIPFHMKRDLPERLLFGREYDYVSTFFFDRAYDYGAISPEELDIFAKSLAQPGNTRGALEWYRAFPLDHQVALVWRQCPLTIPVLALGGEHRYGVKMVPMLQEFATDVSGGCIGNCGHWVVEERPEEAAAALLAFLGGEHLHLNSPGFENT